MPERARSENRPRSGERSDEQSSWEHRTPERPGRCPEPAPSRRPNTRLRLCKHCAASARRRSYPNSFLGHGPSKFPRWNNFLGQRFESRIAAQVVEHRVDPDVVNVAAVVLAMSTLQLIHRMVFVAQSKEHQPDTVGVHVACLRLLIKLRQNSIRLVASPHSGIGLA